MDQRPKTTMLDEKNAIFKVVLVFWRSRSGRLYIIFKIFPMYIPLYRIRLLDWFVFFRPWRRWHMQWQTRLGLSIFTYTTNTIPPFRPASFCPSPLSEFAPPPTPGSHHQRDCLSYGKIIFLFHATCWRLKIFLHHSNPELKPYLHLPGFQSNANYESRRSASCFEF